MPLSEGPSCGACPPMTGAEGLGRIERRECPVAGALERELANLPLHDAGIASSPSWSVKSAAREIGEHLPVETWEVLRTGSGHAMDGGLDHAQGVSESDVLGWDAMLGGGSCDRLADESVAREQGIGLLQDAARRLAPE